jgi:hypothetical protein
VCGVANTGLREYRIRAVIDDEEIGDYSVTKQVTVARSRKLRRRVEPGAQPVFRLLQGNLAC